MATSRWRSVGGGLHGSCSAYWHGKVFHGKVYMSYKWTSAWPQKVTKTETSRTCLRAYCPMPPCGRSRSTPCQSETPTWRREPDSTLSRSKRSSDRRQFSTSFTSVSVPTVTQLHSCLETRSLR